MSDVNFEQTLKAALHDLQGRLLAEYRHAVHQLEAQLPTTLDGSRSPRKQSSASSKEHSTRKRKSPTPQAVPNGILPGTMTSACSVVPSRSSTDSNFRPPLPLDDAGCGELDVNSPKMKPHEDFDSPLSSTRNPTLTSGQLDKAWTLTPGHLLEKVSTPKAAMVDTGLQPLASAVSSPPRMVQRRGSNDEDNDTDLGRSLSNHSRVISVQRDSIVTNSASLVYTEAGYEFEVLNPWRMHHRCRLLTSTASKRSTLDLGAMSEAGDKSAISGEDITDPGLGLWEQAMANFMVQPNSVRRLCWESLSLLLILVDICVVPLQLFNDTPDADLLQAVVWVSRVFWTLDIPLSFLTGYISQDAQGMVEIRPLAVVRRYTRCWFPFDVLVIACDWAEVFVTLMGNESVALRSTALFRAVRVFRLARMAKTQNIADFVLEHIRSEVAMISSYVLGVLFIWVMLIHILSCIWRGIRLSKSSGSVELSYLEAFHYVLALFVGEQIEMPRSMAEQIFTVVVMVFAFIVSASFVGSLTTAMTRLQIIASQRSAQFAALARYLADCHISRRLCVRVQRNARHAFKKRRRNTPETCIELMSLISDPLRAEIHYEVHSPLLTENPFFYLYNMVNQAGVCQICHLTIVDVSISRGDVLFSNFEAPCTPKMFFVANGRLTYYRQCSELQRVQPKQWISEPALWTKWVHRGSLVASTECQLVAIDAQRFGSIATSFQVLHTHAYAVNFVKRLNALNAMGHATDIGEDCHETRQLVASAFQDVDSEFVVPDNWVNLRHSHMSSSRRSSLGEMPGSLLRRLAW